MKLVLTFFTAVFLAACQTAEAPKEYRTVIAEKKDLRATVQSMAEIQPLNKVEILPPVSGRVESIFVEEGSAVRKGQELARISSSDRAALLDAARSKGPEEVRYWESVYRATPIIAPVPGRVIQKNVVPGQTIGTTTVLFQLSDRLIFRAQVDETDIASIHVGTPANVVVDSFPDRAISAKTRLVREQAKLVNNVNIYEVEVSPDQAIEDLRAGMTATVTFIVREKGSALSLPLWATNGFARTEATMEIEGANGKISSEKVQLGEAYGSDVEVLSGLSEGSRIRVVKRQIPTEAPGSSGLVPFGSARKPPAKKP